MTSTPLVPGEMRVVGVPTITIGLTLRPTRRPRLYRQGYGFAREPGRELITAQGYDVSAPLHAKRRGRDIPSLTQSLRSPILGRMSVTRSKFIGLALLLTACASSNTSETHSPSERSSSPSTRAAREEGTGRSKAPLDYNALPDLPEYPCGTDPFETGTGGKLDPAVIQRHVRARYSKVTRCYEEGVDKNPDLGGKVTVRFVIEKDGRVGKAEPVCTSMPDPAVVACIVGEYRQMRFPRPEGGIVTVVYPIMLSPGSRRGRRR